MYRFLRKMLKMLIGPGGALRVRGVSVGKDPVVNGRPIIQVHPSAKIEIGDGVTLNSRNYGYHLNMHSPVKLMADRPDARIVIGDNSRIHGSCIHAYKSVSIGKNCLVAANCQIFDSNGHEISFGDVPNRIHTQSEGRPIVIEDNVWIGANTLVMPGVRIGQGSVISAGSIVKSDIPPMVIAGGNPAALIMTAEEWLAKKARANGK